MKLVSALVLGLGTFATAENEPDKQTKHVRTLETSPKFATAKLALNVDKWMQQNDPIANTIYSPVSLYNILASVYFGTGENSETRTELQEKFNFKESFSPAKYSKKLGEMTKNDALDTFNSYIFHKNNVLPEYAAELASLNFKDKPLETFVGQEDMINGIIEKDTDDMIKNMFAPGSFDSQTSLVLLNTILFKGIWDGRFGKFDPDHTEKKKIWIMGTEKNSPGPFKAQFMKSKKRKMKIYEMDRTLHISMRFEGEVWMTIIMPKANSEKKAHEINFNEVKWESFSRKEATLVLPKFEIESDLDLVEFMKSQGSSRLFSSETADLDRMFGKNSGNYVGKFKQKASIKVHEEGAEAAAATFVGFTMKSMAPTPRTYEIKRPFKFFIHSLKSDEEIKLAKGRGDKLGENQSGALFFSGVVNCPMNNCG